MVERDGPADAPAPAGDATSRPAAPPDARRPSMPRRRLRLAIAAGVALGALFAVLLEAFFVGVARSTWPAYAIALALAALAAAAIGGRTGWPKAAAVVVGSGVATVAVVAAGLMLMLATFGGCEVAPHSAEWEEQPPSIHRQLPDGGEYRGHAVEWTPPAPDGLPLEDPDLDARWGEWSLRGAWWGNDVGGFNFYPLQAEGGLVRGFYLSPEDLRAHRGDVVAFLAALGADPAQALRVAEAMERNATRAEGPIFAFTASMPAAWGPQSVWDSYCCIAESRSAVGGLGQVQLTRGEWAFLFDVERKLLHGDGFTLATDGEGRVVAEGLAMGEGKAGAYRQRILHELGELNLAQPSPASMHVGGSIC